MVDLTFIGNEGPLSADQSSVRGLSSVMPGKELPSPSTPQALGTRPEPGYRRYVTSGRTSDNTLRPRGYGNFTSFIGALVNRFQRQNVTLNSIIRKQMKILPTIRKSSCQRPIQTCAAGKQKCTLCPLVVCYFM
jgi:hypothetical protein